MTETTEHAPIVRTMLGNGHEARDGRDVHIQNGRPRLPCDILWHQFRTLQQRRSLIPEGEAHRPASPLFLAQLILEGCQDVLEIRHEPHRGDHEHRFVAADNPAQMRCQEILVVYCCNAAATTLTGSLPQAGRAA